MDGEALIRVEWARDLNGFLDLLAESGATILKGEGHADVWTFQLRFDDCEDLTTLYRQCADRGISFDLKRVHNPGIGSDDERRFDMTDAQREALQLALEQGYFDVPRRITLTDLAAELGVSDTAVSQRIRRGLSTFLLKTLDESDGRSGRH